MSKAKRRTGAFLRYSAKQRCHVVEVGGKKKAHAFAAQARREGFKARVLKGATGTGWSVKFCRTRRTPK